SAAPESRTAAAKAGRSSAARSGTAVKKAGAKPKSAIKAASTAKAAKADKPAKAAKASGAAPKKKSATRAANKPASKERAAVPTLQRLVRTVAKAAAKIKDEAVDATTAAPSRSAKAPAKADGASTRRTRTKSPVNPKGPEFARNPRERGRVGSVQRRQQARRDSR
ncbi:MAG TPA: hypothetical protein VM406_07475, partial [Noviherbaspirillum sp.]|nr:hypothetical protein [Noviherbaspirillum sp.]